METRLLRHGNSQAIIVPAKFLKSLGIRKGDRVRLSLDYRKGEVRLTFTEARQLRLEVKTGKKR